MKGNKWIQEDCLSGAGLPDFGLRVSFFKKYVPPLCSGIPRIFGERSPHTWGKKKGSLKIKNTSPKLSIILIILITSPWMDQTVRCLRKYYEGVKLQTLFLYLFGVYCMFHQYSNHIQSENRKTANRKNQRYSGLNKIS